VTGAAGTSGVAGVTGAAGVTGTAGTAPVVCSNAGVTGHQPVVVNGGWINRTPATRPAAWPKGRRAAAMAYDFTTGRTVMYGGYANALPAVDTWEWNGTAGTWSEHKVSPPGVFDMFGVAYDSGRGRLLLFGGETYPNGGRSSDVWEWDGLKGAWSLIPAIGMPGTLNNSSAAYDPVRRRVIVHADWEGGVRTLEWDIDGGTWTNINVGNAPRVTGSSSFVWDPCRNRGVYFGGQTGDELWDWNPDTRSWTQRQKFLPTPAPRSHAALVFDTSVGRPLLFGGRYAVPASPVPGAPPPPAPTYYNDLWELTGEFATWTQHEGAGFQKPYGREWSGAAWDSARARLVIFAGGSDVPDLDDVWEWTRR
jgi:hypothetical protein